MNTNTRLLRKMNGIPEPSESIDWDAVRALCAIAITAKRDEAVWRAATPVDVPSCECAENNTQGPCDGCGKRCCDMTDEDL